MRRQPGRGERPDCACCKVTDKPIKYVLLTHYHAVRVLGAPAYKDAEILASDTTRGLIAERGKQDIESRSAASRGCSARWKRLPLGLADRHHLRPDVGVAGRREVRIMHVGRGHTAGDVIATVPDAGSCSLAIWSSTRRPATAATRISPIGQRRSINSPNSRPARWCRRGAALTTPAMWRRHRAYRDFIATLYDRSARASPRDGR